MYVYNVRTIPVPYHINSEMIDEKESEKAYTQIIPDTEMVAMNRDTYMSLSRKRIYVSVLLVQVHGIYRKILFIVKRKLAVIYSYITL